MTSLNNMDIFDNINKLMNKRKRGANDNNFIEFSSNELIKHININMLDKISGTALDNLKGTEIVTYLENYKLMIDNILINYDNLKIDNQLIMISLKAQIYSCKNIITSLLFEYSKNKNLIFKKYIDLVKKSFTENDQSKNDVSKKTDLKKKIINNKKTSNKKKDDKYEYEDKDEDDDDNEEDEDDYDEDDENDDDNDDDINDFYNKQLTKPRNVTMKQSQEFFDELIKINTIDNNKVILDYYSKLTKKNQIQTLKQLKEINNYFLTNKPLLFKIITLDIPLNHKNHLLKKYLTMIFSKSEGSKLRNWVETALTIPFGIYSNLNLKSYKPAQIKDFLNKLKKSMDDSVWGHDDAKHHIIQIMGQQIRNNNSKGNMIGIWGPPGNGKCFALNTPILMYDGTIKNVQDIQIGDIIMGDDSKPRNILTLGNGIDKMYDIINNNSDIYTVNSEHILCLKLFDITFDELKNYINIPIIKKDILEITVNDYLLLPDNLKSRLKGYKTKIDFPNKIISYDPYLIGYLLTLNHNKSIKLEDLENSELIDIKSLNITINEIYEIINKYNFNNKNYIPDEYKINDINIRNKLLSGILNNIGVYNVSTKLYEIITDNITLANDILFLARSIGLNSYLSINKDICEITIDTDNNISLDHDIQIKFKEMNTYYGFTIDGNNRFILGNFSVTHNTTLIKEGISKAMKRPFIFISLGGATDASFLEGHSYTYEGSICGKIAQGLINSKCMDPIFYFDELDKISKTAKGDEIKNILIHLTDTVQNCHFKDKYFHGLELDLSKATFIFSYNDPSLVDYILLDRITQIETKYLLEDQKIHILQNYLIKDLLKEMEFKEDSIIFKNDLLSYIINKYTNEGGIRKLKECIICIIREINISNLIKTKINNKTIEFPVTLDNEMIDIILKNRFINQPEKIHKEDKCGIINGLYACANGVGGIMPIEILWTPTVNAFDIKMTGNLQNIIKESVQVASTLAFNQLPKEKQESYLKKWKISPYGLHIHCSDTSVPKDGPSAGTALTVGIYSILMEKKIRHDIAITGEINLQGNVTAIGGLENKLEGSKKANVKLVLYPKENQKDIDKIMIRNPKLIDNNFKIQAIDTIEEALLYSLV